MCFLSDRGPRLGYVASLQPPPPGLGLLEAWSHRFVFTDHHQPIFQWPFSLHLHACIQGSQAKLSLTSWGGDRKTAASLELGAQGGVLHWIKGWDSYSHSRLYESWDVNSEALIVLRRVLESTEVHEEPRPAPGTSDTQFGPPLSSPSWSPFIITIISIITIII